MQRLEPWRSRTMLSTRPLEQWTTAELRLLEEGFSLATAEASGFAAAGAKVAVGDDTAKLLEGVLLTPVSVRPVVQQAEPHPPSPSPAPPRKQADLVYGVVFVLTSKRRSFLLGLILLGFCAAGYVGWQKYEDALRPPPQIEQPQDQEIRKVTFDLVENAVSIAAEFGRNHYRWRDRVENMLPRAERAAKISTQGQAEYADLLRNTQNYERLAADNFDSYVRSVLRIAEYGQPYAEDAIKWAEQQQRLPIEKEALLLIAQHVQDALQSRVDPDRWRQQLIDQLARREKVF